MSAMPKSALASLFIPDEVGRTPLHAAALNGHDDIVETLLKHGSLVNVKDKSGCTALHFAASNGHAKVVEVLLAHGAKIGAKTANGDNAFELAYDNEKFDVVACLLDSYKRVSDIGLWSASVILLDAVKACHVPLVISTLAKGADVNIGDHGNATPLHIACGLNNIKMASVLLDNGARVGVTNHRNETPLHAVCQHGGTDIADELLKSGADPNAKDCEKATPLHRACRFHQGNMVSLLVENGADVFPKDARNLTPMLSLFEHRPCYSVQGFFNGFLQLKSDIESLMTILSDLNLISHAYQTDKRVLRVAMLSVNGYITEIPVNLLALLSWNKDVEFFQYLGNEIGFTINEKTIRPRLKQINSVLPASFFRQAPLLQAMCRNKIRVLLKTKFESIDNSIKKLGLPKSMKRYLKFEPELAALCAEDGTPEQDTCI